MMSKITKLGFALMMVLSFNTAQARTDALKDQFEKSTHFLFQNLMRADVMPGAIIAAPSKAHPDYFFHWVRDAGLVIEAALDLYESGYLTIRQRQNLQMFFIDHVQFNRHIHATGLAANGLGEPKFYVDGSAYTHPWGRPQNDGPALRASSLTRILSVATKEKWPQVEQLKKALYESKLPTKALVKADLEFVSHNWRDLNFDLWEEVFGAHFYTLMTQRKALVLGTQTATYFMDFGAAQFYKEELKKINAELEKFWDADRRFVAATLWANHSNKSHLDTAVILAVLHSNVEGASFSFNDDRIIATFQRLKDGFAHTYPINKNENFATAFGRYPEDTYDGYKTDSRGNPWVLTTAAAAEYLYRTAAYLSEKQTVEITAMNRKFFKNFADISNVRVRQRISAKHPQFKILVRNLITEGDRYLERIIFHRNSDGSLSEQINHYTGYMQGAPNLTWSHASFLTAKMARDRALKLQRQ